MNHETPASRLNREAMDKEKRISKNKEEVHSKCANCEHYADSVCVHDFPCYER